MTKSTSVIALLGTLLYSSAAIAQTTPSPTPVPPASSTTTSTTTVQAAPVDSRGMLATDVMKAPVRNQQNERVGEVDDLVMDGSGKIMHIIVGVGGFLGIGEHKVALDLNTLKPMRDGNTLVFVGNFTKDSLKTMAEWRNPMSTSVTGTGAGTTGRSTTTTTTTPPATTTMPPASSTVPPATTTTPQR